MKYYRFMIFVLYRIQLKKSTANQAKVITSCNITILQVITALLITIALLFMLDFKLSALKPQLFVIVVLSLIVNYYRYVKSDYFDQIQVQFENSELNNLKNRRTAIIIGLLWLYLPIALIILMSYLKINY